MSRQRTGFLFLIGLLVLLYYAHISDAIPSFYELRAARHILSTAVDTHPWSSSVYFFLAYFGVTFFGLPLRISLSIVGGFLFGALKGLLIMVPAAFLASVIGFMLTRYFFRTFFEMQVSSRLLSYNAPIRSNSFLLTVLLRLSPFVPFLLVTVGLALSRARLVWYALGTLVGILPQLAIYTYAGMRFSEIESLKDVFYQPLLWGGTVLCVIVIGFILFSSRIKSTRA